MAKLDSGAMTIGNNDNWREIFDDQNATAVAANQATADLAPIINGKRCALSVASGGFVLLRNSTITGKADGAYTAAKAIPANTDLDGSYLTAVSGGVANALNSNLIPSISQCSTDVYTAHRTVPINRLIKVGKLVFIHLIMIAESGYSFTTATSFMLPSGYRPSAETRIPVVVKKSGVYSSADGAVDSLGNGWQSYSNSVDEIHINACFVSV